MKSARVITGGREAGFTILELTVVLGLLGGFLVFLLQILSTGVELFDEGPVARGCHVLGGGHRLTGAL